MAELSTDPSTCCAPAVQASCCDPSEKDACCGAAAAGESCGCSAGSEQADIRALVRDRRGRTSRTA